MAILAILTRLAITLGESSTNSGLSGQNGQN